MFCLVTPSRAETDSRVISLSASVKAVTAMLKALCPALPTCLWSTTAVPRLFCVMAQRRGTQIERENTLKRNSVKAATKCSETL